MRRLLALVALAPLASGCADPPGDWAEHVGASEVPIINGTIDTQHDAVVALFGQFSGCTGTIIRSSAGQTYVLTAAHCFEQDPMQQVAIGDNYQQAEQVLQVVDWQQHPSYDDNELVYDFAMIRAVGGNGNIPVIPVLSDADDTLAPGTPITHVGYGLLSSPNGNTSRRHYANGTIGELYQIQIVYNQPSSGPCSGDSGGPNLVDLGAGERVAGVISYGDETCGSYGVSGRASSVFGWINQFMGTDPNETTSAATTDASATSSVASTATGAGGATAAAGVGGAGPSTGSSWVAGDAEAEDYDGELLSSGACAVSTTAVSTSAGSSTPNETNWASFGLALIGLLFARRALGKSRV